MKKVFKRAVNILTLLTLAMAFFTFFVGDLRFSKSIATVGMVLCSGFAVVLIFNYVFFGAFTLWNKIEPEE